MILDYHADLAFAKANGIEVTDYSFTSSQICFRPDDEGETYHGITFRNFPSLEISDCIFRDCSFENCEDIRISECKMIGCIFRSVESICGEVSDFYDCSFEDCVSKQTSTLLNVEGTVSGCKFERIHVSGEDCFVVESSYPKHSDIRMITNCRFTDCVTDEAGAESDLDSLITCTYRKALSSRSYSVSNIDHETCEIRYT